jgi:hypothetical protein
MSSTNIAQFPRIEPNEEEAQDIFRRAADVASTHANATPTLRPRADRSEFIEKTVQSLAQGYTYGNVPNYYKIAEEIWNDRISYWDEQDKKAREEVYRAKYEEAREAIYGLWRQKQADLFIESRKAKKDTSNETPDAR